MATAGVRARRRRQRLSRARRNAQPIVAHVLAGRVSRKRKGRRNAKGLLADLGNSLFPGLGGTIGQIGDNLIGGVANGLLGGMGKTVGVANAGRSHAQQAASTRLRGIEDLVTIDVPAGTPAGTILLQSLVAAPALGTRLAKLAELWSNTVFAKLAVKVTSANPSTVAGNYTVAYDPDPVQSYTSGPELPGRLMALTQATKANAWADAYLPMAPTRKTLFNRFHTATAGDAEIRDFADGQLIIATTTSYDTDCQYTVTVGWDVLEERPDTLPNSGKLPTTYILAMGGASGLTSPAANVIRFTSAQKTSVWNVVPPVGTYSTPSLGIGWVAGSVNGPATVLSIDNTSTHMDVTISSSPTLPASGITIGAQTPVAYLLQTHLFALSEVHLIKTGFCLHHPVFSRKSHTEWHTRAIGVRLQRVKLDALKVVHRRRAEAEVEQLDDQELDRRIRSLTLAIDDSTEQSRRDVDLQQSLEQGLHGHVW